MCNFVHFYLVDNFVHIQQLCCTRFGREYLREKQTYLILRELHKWEEDSNAKEACEKVVQILIGDENEQDNLEVAIPPDHHL